MRDHIDHTSGPGLSGFGLFATGTIAFVSLLTQASGESVFFGTLTELVGPEDLDLEGNIIYAIDVGGPGGILEGVLFSEDNNPYSPATTGANNELGPGTWESPSTPGYFPGLNSPGNWNTQFSGYADLDALMSYGRNDSATLRVSELRVVSGQSYQIQILGKYAFDMEDRTWDLAVGSGTEADLADAGALTAWHAANLAVDNWQEQVPKVWSHTLTATSDRLWIGAANANSFGDPASADPNPIINAIIIEAVAPDEAFRVTTIERDDGVGEIRIEFTSTPGASYAVDYTENLNTPFWEELSDGVQATATRTTFVDSDATRLARPNGYYRIRDLSP